MLYPGMKIVYSGKQDTLKQEINTRSGIDQVGVVRCDYVQTVLGGWPLVVANVL